MQVAEAALRGLLQRYTGRKLTSTTFHEMNELLKDFRVKCRHEGLAFPELKALVIPRLGAVDLVNAELEGDALRLRVVAFTRRHPAATLREVVQAVKWAFPDYKGGGFEGFDMLSTGRTRDGS